MTRTIRKSGITSGARGDNGYRVYRSKGGSFQDPELVRRRAGRRSGRSRVTNEYYPWKETFSQVVRKVPSNCQGIPLY